MKRIQSILALGLIISLVACGGVDGSNSGTNSTSDTGTVSVIGGTTGTTNNLSSLVTEESADEVLVRTYRISLGDSADCETANFIDIFDETGDTSDCVSNPSDTSDFVDISQSPEFGSNSAFAAGTYSCVRVTMCDQLVWSSSALTECSGTQVADVSGDESSPEVHQYYWSTNGSSDDNQDDPGSAEQPFALEDALEVIAGTTTTFIFNMNNSDNIDGMVGAHDDERSSGDECEIPAPSMSITAQE